MADFIALHLSDIDGVPMYAVENGWYWYQQDQQKGLDYIRASHCCQIFRTKKEFTAFVMTLMPKWKLDALSVIAKYELA